MLQSDLPLLACPACAQTGLVYRPPAGDYPLPPGFDRNQHYWEGALACAQCGREFPLLDGVACLGVLNRDWRIPLKEIESKLSITMRQTRKTHWEAGRAEAHAHQSGQVQTLMDHLFECALEETDFSSHPKILDLGCGGGATTNRFVELGARAIGVDADIGQLRYLSFDGIDRMPPGEWRHPASGHLFHDKDPHPLRHYFTRVFADISRLPFAPGAFDIVFCRSVLHHLDDHRRILQGAMRVLRPGGKVVFCSEPMRAILTVESEFMREDTVECEEGMNERVWPLWHYMGPIFPFTRGVTTHTWPNDPSPSLVRRTLGLAWPLRRRIGAGARVRGWRLPALAFVNGSFNLYATRNDKPVGVEPIAGDTLPGADFKELVELFRVNPGQAGAGVNDLPRKRSVVDGLRRAIMAREVAPPSAIAPHKEPQFKLENGWLKKTEHAGRGGRLISWDASVFLGRAHGMKKISVSAARAVPADVELRVLANDLPAGAARVDSNDWKTYEFELPEGLDEGVVSVRLLSQAPDSADPAAPPLMIERIEIRQADNR